MYRNDNWAVNNQAMLLPLLLFLLHNDKQRNNMRFVVIQIEGRTLHLKISALPLKYVQIGD